MAPNAGIRRFLTILLVTDWVVVRDLEVLVPPSFMLFRRASFQTVRKTHKYKMSPQLLGRIGLGDEDGMELNLDSQKCWCFKLPRW